MSNQKPSTGHPSEIEGWVNLRGFATSSLVGGYDHSSPILFDPDFSRIFHKSMSTTFLFGW